MLYDVKVAVSGSRSIEYKKSTKIGAQNIFESFLADGSDFTFAVKEHIHNHLWYSDSRESNGDVNFMCKDCGETFKLSQTVLTACHAGEAAAQEHGF